MSTQIITLEVKTNADPSTLLDLSIEFGEQLAVELDGYFDESSVCVEEKEPDIYQKQPNMAYKLAQAGIGTIGYIRTEF